MDNAKRKKKKEDERQADRASRSHFGDNHHDRGGYRGGFRNDRGGRGGGGSGIGKRDSYG